VTTYRGWQRRFDDPIPLPRGRQLVTLQDAGNYITKLPKPEHDTPEWQAAMEALLLVVPFTKKVFSVKPALLECSDDDDGTIWSGAALA
jgi:hypothetical protein